MAKSSNIRARHSRRTLQDLTLPEIAAEIRTKLDRAYPECKFEVKTVTARDVSSIVVTLAEAPFNALENSQNGYWPVNPYQIERDVRLSTAAKELLSKVAVIGNERNWEISDTIPARYDPNYYLRLNVGSRQKPFKNITINQVMQLDKDKKRPYPVPADGKVDLNKMDGDRMNEILVEATLGVPTVFKDYTEEVFRRQMDEFVADCKAKGLTPTPLSPF